MDGNESSLDTDTTLHELRMATEGGGYTAPGQDQLAMLCSDNSQMKCWKLYQTCLYIRYEG